MTEAEEFLAKRRAVKFSQTFFNSVMLVGLLSMAIALVVMSMVREDDKAAVTVFADRVQSSLRETCSEANQAALPASTQQDCKAAEQNKLPEQIERVIDEPDPNDPEAQDSETQDPEIQDPETQDSETQDPELPDEETNDPDPVDDPDPDDPEIQDPEIDDPSIPGPQGVQGEKGEKGDKGDQGDPGPTCPVGYTATEQFVEGNPMTTEDDQTWLVCVKDQ